MTSKITPEAKHRCAAHTMQEQLAQMRGIHAVETALLKKRQSHDMRDIDLALKADDLSWGGQHARLHPMPLEGAD